MRITVCAIGRMRDKHERALAEGYMSRAQALGRSLGITDVSLTEIETKGDTHADAKALLAALPDTALIVALDETGRQRTSRDLAHWLDQQKDGSTRDIAFVIGGADGHGPEVISKARETLSLGAMTWPHMLARIMLLEQIYRAISILARHPYHRD